MPLPLLVGTGRALLVGGDLSYFDKVRSIAPANQIGYWPMWEPSGTVSVDYSGQANNGAYTGVTLGQAGIGDGRTCPLFDGTNDFNNIYSAALNTDFNGQALTMAGWARVSGVGVWTDGANRQFIRITGSGSNVVLIRKTSTNNQVGTQYIAAGTTESITSTLSVVGWFHWALTASLAADEVKFYINGAQTGVTSTGLGTWDAAALTSTACCIGASNTTPDEPWSGYLAHVLLCNVALSATQIAALATL